MLTLGTTHWVAQFDRPILSSLIYACKHVSLSCRVIENLEVQSDCTKGSCVIKPNVYKKNSGRITMNEGLRSSIFIPPQPQVLD